MIVAKRRVLRVSNEIHGPTGQPFVIRIDPGGRTVSIKIKGRRTWFTVTVKQLYSTGAWNAAAVLKAKKKAERLERKRLRSI